MPNENLLNAGEQEFERQLGRLEPAGHCIDRDALMFRAGQQSARQSLRAWKTGSGALLLLVGGLAFWNLDRPEPDRVSERADHGDSGSAPLTRIARDYSPSARHRARTALSGDYLKVRELLTFRGADALPSSPYASVSQGDADSIATWLRRSRAAATTPGGAGFRSETDNGGRS